MDSESDLDQLLLLQSEAPTPTDQNPKMKRLKKNDSTANDVTTSSAPSNEIDGLDTGNDEFDGFDPLFGDSSQFSAKRVLDFDDSFDGFGSEDENDDPDFDKNKNKQEKKKRESSIEFLDNKEKKKRKSSIEFRDNKEKKKREGSVEFRDNKEKKRRVRSDLEKNKSIVSSRKEKKERKARSNQQADFQRVMRDMKGVGFKPIPMVEKSISSVLEKIRKRKMEVSKKWASYTEEDEEVDGGADKDEAKEVGGTKNDLAKDDGGVEKDQVKDDGVAEKDKENAVSLIPTSEEKPESSDEQTTCGNLIQIPSKDAITHSFRAPINDTQDLLMDSERNNSQDDELPSCPDEDITPSAPSMNLRWDSGHSAAVDDDLSSSDEESDKENTDPHPKHLQRSSTVTGDPVKDFVDEEALEDDSDDDFLRSQEQDDEDNSDMEENCDYIATDVKEKPIDGEMRNQLHQQWDQQHDEAVTEKLLQKLKYGTKKREPSISDNEDADRTDADEEEEEDDDEEDKNVPHMSSSRATTKRLKQMIPLMFTDKDDGFVSSDDEETERMLSKQCLLQKVEMEKQPKVLPPVADETSKEVLDRIKKVNVPLETKKKSKTPSIFEALLNKGSSSDSSKSSFLRRASSHPGPSSHRHGPKTGKSFIFGRDDSNSRSSMTSLEDSLNMGQKENQPKKNSSAKFTGSQAKLSTQHTETRSETANGSSLYDILRSSSAETSYDTRDNAVDHEAVFAAFKSVKKQVKIEQRTYQGP